MAAPLAPVGGPARAYDPSLTRYPYLTDVVGPYATVNWATDAADAPGRVTWGRVGSEPCTAHAVHGTNTDIRVNNVTEYQWKAELTLSPGQQYCYRVYLGSADLLGDDPSPRFWTQVPAASSQPFKFVVFGDWGSVDDDGDNIDQANLMRQIAASGARFAVTVGDNGYPSGSQTNYGDLRQEGPKTSGVFGPPFWKVPGASIPIFPALGNHGLARSDTSHPALLNWPQDRAVALSHGRYRMDTYCCVNGTSSQSYPSAWYAFDAGNARFYVLDAAWDDGNTGQASSYKDDRQYHWRPTSPEYRWLEHDLATHPTPLKFAFFHYPLYSDDSTEPSDTYLQGSGSLEGLLSRYGVDIVFTGHAHIYQRNLRDSSGLISYVTGGGGGEVEPIGGKGCSPIDAYGIGWSYSGHRGSACGSAPRPTSAAQVHHFLLVSVDGARVTVSPTDEYGDVFDEQTYDFGVTTDTLPPVVSITSPPEGADVGRGRLTLVARARDNAGIDHVDFVVNGRVVARDDAAPFRAVWDTARLDGAIRIAARAVDTSGNAATSRVSIVTIDSTPPDTIVLPVPRREVHPKGVNSASFSWTGRDNRTRPGELRYSYKLDNGSWSAWSGSTTVTLTRLKDGAHTLHVRARDRAGNVDPTPATRTWTVDTRSPEVRITSGPRGLASSTSASFAFESNEPSSRLECSLDGAAYVACSSPTRYTGLTGGTHIFRVRAIDRSGNVSTTPSLHAWTIDTIPPEGTVSINDGAVYTRSARVDLSVPAQDEHGISKVRVSGDGRRWAVYDYSEHIGWDLGDAAHGGSGGPGVHKVYVQWLDRAGNWSEVRTSSIVLDTFLYSVEIPAVLILAGLIVLAWWRLSALRSRRRAREGAEYPGAR